VLLEPTAPVVVGAGEAVSSDNQPDEIFKGAHCRIVETLEHPNSITAGASGCRLSAAMGAEVLEPAIDAAMSAQARNSIEKMLCHQMAGAHFTAMRLLERSANPILQPGETARFTNAAARMMDVYQAACLTLLKLKTRGTQRVLVQYQQINVGPGGKALVAGRVGGGSRRRGRGGKRPMNPMNRELGPLRNGNPRGDLSKARRCGAKTRRDTLCQCPAMRNRQRCRLHGGKSTGPRTAAGLERSRRARWRHGVYSRETRAILADSRRRWRELRALLVAV
jgi:hypothetical protein